MMAGGRTSLMYNHAQKYYNSYIKSHIHFKICLKFKTMFWSKSPNIEFLHQPSGVCNRFGFQLLVPHFPHDQSRQSKVRPSSLSPIGKKTSNLSPTNFLFFIFNYHKSVCPRNPLTCNLDRSFGVEVINSQNGIHSPKVISFSPPYFL